MVRRLGYDRRALAAQTALTWMLLPLSFAARPGLRRALFPGVLRNVGAIQVMAALARFGRSG
jgi:hypothetical protein